MKQNMLPTFQLRCRSAKRVCTRSFEGAATCCCAEASPFWQFAALSPSTNWVKYLHVKDHSESGC